MKRAAWVAVLSVLPLAAVAEPLTLEAALAAVESPHPDRRIAESDLALARAARLEAASRRDFSLYIDGTLRRGRRPDDGWKPDNAVRLVARKPVLDFGRSSDSIDAAERGVEAREAELVGTLSARRVDIMARYFDVLLADMQYAADNEFMAVAYVSWDNATDRFEVGDISRPELLRLEADYQDIRERRNASMQRMRIARQRLAHAINRPTELADELVDPMLADNRRSLPEFEALLAWVMENNPRVRALKAEVAAAEARIAAVRTERNPTLDVEVAGARYSRESTTRDDVSAGLVFTVPFHQGRRVDARIARELAQKERSAAELEKLGLDLKDAVLATLQEIEWLRASAQVAADRQIEYRDWALERARAEYELELKTDLGTSMAETQVAQLRRKRVEYQLALALARLEALSGGSLPPTGGVQQ
ncbi:MAG: TolC family protein [Thiobacillus sp.]